MNPLHLSTVAAALLIAAPAVAQGSVDVGDTPTFSFGEKTFNAMGKTEAANFRGKPTLVEFWGTR